MNYAVGQDDWFQMKDLGSDGKRFSVSVREDVTTWCFASLRSLGVFVVEDADQRRS